jgi:hypothetical protein
MASYWFLRVAAAAGPHPLSSPSFHCLARVTGWTPPLAVAYSVLSIPFSTGARQPNWGGAPGVGFLDVRAFGLSEECESGLCSSLLLTRGVCCACFGSVAGSSNARAVSLVRCDSSQFMSLCIGLPAIAGRLIALLCNSCMLSQLLLICDIESALSLLAGMMCLLYSACDVRACSVVSCRVFPTAGR